MIMPDMSIVGRFIISIRSGGCVTGSGSVFCSAYEVGRTFPETDMNEIMSVVL
ncbi:hypothetical protein GGR01_003169 [Acetobacter oeni]|nr:hypothetical protein [Acetobacter oeni]